LINLRFPSLEIYSVPMCRHANTCAQASEVSLLVCLGAHPNDPNQQPANNKRGAVNTQPTVQARTHAHTRTHTCLPPTIATLEPTTLSTCIQYNKSKVGGDRLVSNKMYFYEARDGHVIYMGKDKHENEHLIKHGWPEDVWFHVDNLSSAHVYLRLKRGPARKIYRETGTLDHIPEALEDCLQLVKGTYVLDARRL
jgi:hypothetical protein